MTVVVRTQPRLVGGRIELMSLIGEGGCASVWLGRHRETNNLVAAKLVHARQDHDHLAMRFQREAELSAGLVHRNLVRVHDYFREPDGQPVLLMEYLRGQTVEEVLHEQVTISVEASVAIAVAVLRGLHQAHELGIIHRDIKPSNIFLAAEPDGVVIPKVLDFGIAKSSDVNAISLTQDGEVLGTPAYMSPEQVRGGDVDQATDIFSLGAVLYEMLTGKLAFAANTPGAALAAVLERTIEPHPAIPERLWAVIARALSKTRQDRHRSLEEFRWELEEAAGYGEATGQQAIQDLHIVVPKLPLLPQLTPSPFSPSSPRLPIAATTRTLAAPSGDDRGSLHDDSALTTTSPAGERLPKRRVSSWVLAGGACASIAVLVMFAWAREGSSALELQQAASVQAELPAGPAPPVAPVPRMQPVPAPAPAPEVSASASAENKPAPRPVVPAKAKPRSQVGINPGF